MAKGKGKGKGEFKPESAAENLLARRNSPFSFQFQFNFFARKKYTVLQYISKKKVTD